MKAYALALAATLAIAGSTVPASAAVLQYTLNGYDFDGTREFASFRLDSKPVVPPPGSNGRPNFELGSGFRLKYIPGTFQYGNDIRTLQDVSFQALGGPNELPGGLFNSNTNDETGSTIQLFLTGVQLYTGPENAPTLLTGTFALADGFSGQPLQLVVSTAPEPAAWGMMIFGLGAVGIALRRRHPLVAA